MEMMEQIIREMVMVVIKLNHLIPIQYFLPQFHLYLCQIKLIEMNIN